MFELNFDNQVLKVGKIQEENFTSAHHDILSQVRHEQGKLVFPDARWHCLYLGAGEEKAVFCVCDHENRVFALELIDERHYLNGRFVGGKYFFNKRVNALANVRARADAEFGLTFTGLIKVREFVHGYEWAQFQFDARRKSWPDGLLTTYLQTVLASQFNLYQSHYKDVHARNVLFEIREWSRVGVPIIVKNWAGKLKVVKIGLQPVDVR